MEIKELFRQNIPRAILIIFLFVLYTLGGTFNEYLFKYALNDITAGNLTGYVQWQAIELALALLVALLLPVATQTMTRQVQNYIHQIRKDLTHHYYAGGDEKVSKMQNELTANLKLLDNDYATPWIDILSAVLQIVFGVALLISMNWLLLLFTAILAVVTLLLPKIMEKKTSAAMKEVNVKNEKLLNTIEHWLGGLQELRRYTAYARLSRELHKASHSYVDANKQSYKYRNISYIINTFGNAIAQIGMSALAGFLFIFHQISFGDWAVAGSFAFLIFSSIFNMTSAITRVKSTKELREQTFLLRKKIKDESENKQPAYGITVSNLSAKYENGEQISYPDFSIKPGAKVLLTGDSGTGKSTLFKLLLGKMKPESGEIKFTDQAGNLIPFAEAKVGYLPQDPIVFPASISDNITMFNEKLADKVEAAVSGMQLAPDLAKMPNGVQTVIDVKNENISGGQRQKVVLARSAIHDQPFVLMDEVTSAIDRAGSEKIIDNLLHSNRTILMIAHNLSPEVKAKFDQEIKLTRTRKEANR